MVEFWLLLILYTQIVFLDNHAGEDAAYLGAFRRGRRNELGINLIGILSGEDAAYICTFRRERRNEIKDELFQGMESMPKIIR